MSYVVGVDLGTTYVSAAVSGSAGTRMVSLSSEVVVPSVAYRAPDGSLLTGSAALSAAADPARVARGFKRRLGDPTPLMLDGSPYAPAALMAAQLRDVLASVTRTEGGQPDSIVLTCPAIWGPYRREHFAEVPRLAGVGDYHLITEPEAAATHYSVERRLGDGEVVAVYDLGGGTFDTTILRMRSGQMEILGTPEGIEHMGGIDFDETLEAHVDDRLDGAISGLDPADPVAATALTEIRAVCVRAKEELSIEPDVRLSVPLPSGPRDVLISRLEFNEMIRPSVQRTTEALRRTIASADLRADDLSAVLLAGGSSRIPLVAQLVSQEFGKPVRVTLHPKFTVALGAATATATHTHTLTTAASSRAPQQGQPPPVPVPAPTERSPVSSVAAARQKRLVPAAALVLVAAVITLVFTVAGGAPRATSGKGVAATSGSDVSATTSTSETMPTSKPTSTPKPVPPTLRVLDDGAAVRPWTGFIGSSENWGGIGIGRGGASQSAISATLRGPSGLRVTWAGGEPAQVYLQNPAASRNLQSYVDSDGALVFDISVHRAPTEPTTVAIHCGYPCGAEVPVTALFRELPTDRKTTVAIPLSCFTERGLDPTMVDTPFLVYTDGRFEATFDHVRWKPRAAASQDPTPCDQPQRDTHRPQRQTTTDGDRRSTHFDRPTTQTGT